MTLEDFFTLTEMSNGLTAPARVQELVSMMQKEVCGVVNKNGSEITRQWSAVASAIAATENKECLQLFIQLDGLCLIDSWLKDAQKFVNDHVEELITRLLQAVERLHVDNDQSVPPGIRVTVKSLLDHESSKVQERARTLFGIWEKEKDGDDDAVSVGPEKVEALIDDGTRVIENLVGENGQSEPSPEHVSLAGVEKCEENVGNNNDQNLEYVDGNQRSPSLSKPVDEDGKVEHLTCHAETTSAIDTCSSAGLRHGTLDGQTGVSVLDPVNYSNNIQEDRSSDKLDLVSAKPLEEKTSCSGTDAGDTSDAGSGSNLQRQTGFKDAGSASDLQRQTGFKDEVSHGEKSSSPEASFEGKTLMDDSRPTNHGRKYTIDRLQDSSHEHTSESYKDFGAILSKVDVNSGDDKQVSDESTADLENDTEFEQPQTCSKDSGLVGYKVDIGLDDYGMIDPLEVARQVAMEVEMEVEQSSSSSEKIQESKFCEPDSPDSTSAKQFQKVESSKKQEVQRGIILLTEASMTNTEGAGPKSGEVKRESSQGTDAEKGPCDFDLNLEVCSDNIDHLEDHPIATSISVVSASKAAAAPGMPVSPLEFEGALGWKGSASTSAFRPASPRRIPQSAKAVPSDSSKMQQQQGWLDFDLNVAEGGNGKSAVDVFTAKQVPLPSALPSGESSSPKKSVMLELDLNCASEEGEAPADWRMEGRLFLDRNNGHWSQSPLSSSSSKHFSSRNFDLNDQPSFLNDSSDLSYFKKPSHGISASGGRIKSDSSVVSIMGMKVEVKREDVLQSFPFQNGRTAENAIDLNVARSGSVLGMGSPFLYGPSAFGYNGGIAPGPPIPFSAAMYGHGVGPVPYMVDSRGAPVVPQILGSASSIPPSFAQQPFIISMGGAPVPNGVGPPRSNLDLNTGLVLEGGNRDPPGILRQFLNQGQVRSMDEHFRTSSQASTSSHVGDKRKEPDGGWEPPYPFRHHPPPWK